MSKFVYSHGEFINLDQIIKVTKNNQNNMVAVYTAAGREVNVNYRAAYDIWAYLEKNSENIESAPTENEAKAAEWF